ncbi:hypothetical protein [Occallatibacter savannae]|uniref:hypothetical protein n=1 Tax=Occallatibacter savannae TaxID=1002691 RepID=UPI0013A5A8EC|nr:hypothetical protein [Occallatibacter savannae]
MKKLPLTKKARLVREIPTRYRILEPSRPLSLINDDPVFDDYDAADFLGVSRGQMKKWRQRDRGPVYFQYEEDGPVRYPLSGLKKFQMEGLVYPNEKMAREHAEKLASHLQNSSEDVSS